LTFQRCFSRSIVRRLHPISALISFVPFSL
jgi:hypothetical protein